VIIVDGQPDRAIAGHELILGTRSHGEANAELIQGPLVTGESERANPNPCQCSRE
jgi:hypothetical protein